MRLLENEKENITYILEQEIYNATDKTACVKLIIDFSNYLYWTIPSTMLLIQALSFLNDIHDNELKAELSFALGRMYEQMKKYAYAKDYFEKAKEQFEMLNITECKKRIVQCLKHSGEISRYQKNFGEAKITLSDAMTQFHKIGDNLGANQCLHSLGLIEKMQHNYPISKRIVTEALIIYEQIDKTLGAAQCLFALGNMEYDEDDYIAAYEFYQNALTRFKKLGPSCENYVADVFCSLGNVAYMQNNCSECEAFFLEAVKWYQKLNDKISQAEALQMLGKVAYMQKKCVEAKNAYMQAVKIFENCDMQTSVSETMKLLHEVESYESQH
ncbi:TPR-like protein [Rickenella mellea]|uniref:TPR-like protein n=1 Tax=Rickenella mellea TaxID=50990 RepID=A0A4Y7PJ80_9AGAM|nr:TPR-like protein [Rickenella mellea]